MVLGLSEACHTQNQSRPPPSCPLECIPLHQHSFYQLLISQSHYILHIFTFGTGHLDLMQVPIGRYFLISMLIMEPSQVSISKGVEKENVTYINTGIFFFFWLQRGMKMDPARKNQCFRKHDTMLSIMPGSKRNHIFSSHLQDLSFIDTCFINNVCTEKGD